MNDFSHYEKFLKKTAALFKDPNARLLDRGMPILFTLRFRLSVLEELALIIAYDVMTTGK
jgi:hypothetical protein